MRIAVGGFQQGAHVVVNQPTTAGQAEEGCCTQAQQATAGAGPDAALPILEQAGHAVCRQARTLVEVLQATFAKTVQALRGGAEPQVAASVAQQGLE